MLTIVYAVREIEVIYGECSYADSSASLRIFPIIKVVLSVPRHSA
jgi:hypothetical protein